MVERLSRLVRMACAEAKVLIVSTEAAKTCGQRMTHHCHVAENNPFMPFMKATVIGRDEPSNKRKKLQRDNWP